MMIDMDQGNSRMEGSVGETGKVPWMYLSISQHICATNQQVNDPSIEVTG